LAPGIEQSFWRYFLCRGVLKKCTFSTEVVVAKLESMIFGFSRKVYLVRVTVFSRFSLAWSEFPLLFFGKGKKAKIKSVFDYEVL